MCRHCGAELKFKYEKGENNKSNLDVKEEIIEILKDFKDKLDDLDNEYFP
jgi:hypothetical protein